MNTDWKDALSALRDSVQEPSTDVAKTESRQKEETTSTTQKEPLTVVTDKKGRNGKTATIIEGFLIEQSRVEEVAKKLKQKLGVGGSVREGEILIQGDFKEKVKNLLKELGFKTK